MAYLALVFTCAIGFGSFFAHSATAELYTACFYDMTLVEADTTDSLSETARSIIVHSAQKIL
jgi:hypothetical protein